MTDRIDRIVDRAAECTRALLLGEITRWPIARDGLERILGDLRKRAPGHPGLERLRRMIADLSLIYGDEQARP